MAMDVTVFDFDDPESWSKVQAVVNEPLAVRALEAGMKARCRELEEEWTPALGPWQLSDKRSPSWATLESLAPTPDGPNWYRILGYCHTIAPWCAAIGSLVYPDHQWLVWYNNHVRRYRSHSAGMGFRDGQPRSIVIIDILWSQQTLLNGTEWQLMKLLAGPKAFALPIEDAIKHLEDGNHAKKGCPVL